VNRGAELSLEQKAALVCGSGFWSTVAVEDAGIRPIVLSDGPHGLRNQAEGGDHLGLGAATPATCFPPAAALASSFNRDLVERVGRALGDEARAQGVSVLLGPGVNIKRSPLCGRNFEYFSEDPLVSGHLGGAWVRGLQSRGVGASLKHFAANNQETNRMTVSAEVDEATLRELYLPAFEYIVTTEQPYTVMCAYNRINGVYAAENSWLLTEVLRGEWGFEGAVVSDWGAVDDAVAAVAAGTDLEMPGPQRANAAAIVAAVASGALSEKSLHAAVDRVIALAALGDQPIVEADYDANHELARDAAAESIVLLRNEGVLPLSRSASVAVYGDLERMQGAGSSQVTATRVDGFLPDIVRSTEPTDAAAADAAIVLVGLPAADESEGFDRRHLDLPASALELIAAVTTAQPNTVVVLTNGGVVTLEPWHDSAAAIVEAWLLGQGGGVALERVLFGEVNPSGKLAETIPVRLQDTPSYLNFPGTGDVVRYGEGVFVGYRYYEAVDLPVRYPFGHGLSYTTFSLSSFSATPVEATVTVTNTGAVAGAEVVQVYLAGNPTTLVAFEKVWLGPGQSTTVTLAIPSRAFQRWVAGSWQTAGGTYELRLGRNAHEVVAVASLRLPSSLPRRRLGLESSVTEWFENPVTGPIFRRVAGGATEGGASVVEMVGSMPMRRLMRFPGVDIPEWQLRALARVANLVTRVLRVNRTR